MGCIVRKKVGRDSTDGKSVITTYKGHHNHHVRNSGSDTLAQNAALVIPTATSLQDQGAQFGNHHFGQLLDDGSFKREISAADVDSGMSVKLAGASGEVPLLINEFSQQSLFFSQLSGVHYRPDTRKWVAEIKIPRQSRSFAIKMLLGSYKSQVEAALAVDAARKVLKCRKKKPNFPCEKLEAFSEVLPPHLSLNDCHVNHGMLKSVSDFVKGKAKKYASEFVLGLPISMVENQGIGAHTPVTQKNKQPDFGDESSSKRAPPISRLQKCSAELQLR